LYICCYPVHFFLSVGFILDESDCHILHNLIHQIYYYAKFYKINYVIVNPGGQVFVHIYVTGH